MTFAVTILGSGAAVPTGDRNPAAHIVTVRNRLILLDCGEGTQLQLRKAGVRMQKISHIFISHLHGDHYFGLIGLINTMHLLGRKQELHLYGIPDLKVIIDLQLNLSQTTLLYPLIFHPIDPSKSLVVLDDEQLTVTTIPLNHRVPTCGFLIREKPLPRKIWKEFVSAVKIPVTSYEKIKNGEDFIDENGTVYQNNSITQNPPEARSYAYCTDTAYHEEIIPIIKNCDLLYHEATFTEERAEDARAKYHSTAREAATIALKSNAKKLVIGHFSARYNDPAELLNEARQVFPETIAAGDGLHIEL